MTTIKWTDEAVRAAMHAYDNMLGRRWADMMRAALDAATAEQFRPETDAEKAKRYEAAMRGALIVLDAGGTRDAFATLSRALAGPNSKDA